METWVLVGIIWLILAIGFLRWNHVVSKRNKEADREFEKFAADKKNRKETS